MPTWGEGSKQNLEGVHPKLRKVLDAAIADCPVDFTITSGVRTTEEQKALYAQGRTAPGRIVTYADGVRNKSNHQAKDDGFGHAVDFVPLPVDWQNPEPFAFVAGWILAHAARMGIPVKWGGFWPKLKKDSPHLELEL